MSPLAPRFDIIDVLRGISIVAVVLHHIMIRMSISHFPFKPLLAPWLFHLLFRNGGNGVTVFFAVSGFLITITSLRRFGSLGWMRPLAFYRVRFARIAPLLLLLLAVLSFLHLVKAQGFAIAPGRGTLPGALFSVLTFQLNWYEAVHGYLPPSWDILWSLSVEEMFYLFFPLVCFVLMRLRRGYPVYLAFLVAFLLLGPFARTIWAMNEIWGDKTYLGGMDAIALGCLSAMLTNRFLQRGIQFPRRLLLAIETAGAAMILLIAFWPGWTVLKYIGRIGVDVTILAAGTCLVMISSVLLMQRGSRFTEPLRWFGRHSYEVYLTHEFVIVWGTILYVQVQRGPLYLWTIAMLLLSGALGALVARYFSEPWNRKLRPTVPRPPASTEQVHVWAKSS